MTIEAAIKEASKNGYNPKMFGFMTGNFKYIPEVVFLDPLFWQALGKSLGWKDKLQRIEVRYYDGISENPILIYDTHGDIWWQKWHSFIDHLAEGKTPEQFFKELK